jgi:hypothetical protein
MALTAACGSDPAPVAACVTGQTIACACAGGVSGVQVCLPDHSYGACACTGSDAGATDTPAADVGGSDVMPPMDAPVVDAPAPDAPTSEQPSIDAPVADVPSIDAPVADVPSIDTPTVDAPPTVDVRPTDVPPTDAAATDAPATDAPPACPAVSIGSAGGTVSCSGASLTVPAGALAAPVSIQITATGSTAPTGYTGYSPIFRFEPAGTTFAVPVRVSLPFTGDASRATLFWSRATGGSGYERIGGLASGSTLTGSVTHFSTGFIGDGVDYSEPADRRCTATRLLEGRTVSPSGIAMFFTAEDCLGRPLTDLTGADFVVREDGTPLSSEASATLISRVGPQVFVSLVLDVSASTSAFLPQLIAAARRFVTTLQTDRHLPVQISVQVFAGESGLTEWQPPTVDTARLLSRLDALSSYTAADPGSTNLFGATITALSRQSTAEAAFRARNAGGAFTSGYVVLFTDGGDTAGLRTQAEATEAVRASTDRTLAVGLAGGDFMPSVLSALAPAGALISPDASTLTREFNALASRIAGEFRTLYLLGYCSARRAGSHTVTVEVGGGTTSPAASYGFSAAAFGPGCSAATFTGACAAADQCGGLGCGACDDRASLCDGPSRRCVDDCVTANRCGGATFTNPLGYTQTCPDRPDATACAGACRNTLTDTAHCGACGNACTGGSPCIAGVCMGLPPRQLAPLSSSTVTSQQPTLRWVPGGSTEGTRIELCRNRAMTLGCLAPVDTTGSSVRPAAALAPGVWFWRLSGRRGGATVTTPTPTWQFTVGARSAPRDGSWGSTFDVNGDGYADLAVGSGSSAYVYTGGATGLAATPVTRSVFASTSVVSAGDVNGDGFSDLLVSSTTANGLSLFLGGASGLATTAITRMPTFGAFAPGPVAALGDVNNDGYADFAFGPYVYLGGASGPAATATALPDLSGLALASASVAGVGDVNGDGFGDVLAVVGSGAVYLYRGGATALTTPTAVTLPSGSTCCGLVIAAAGDVNGDGLTDALVGARGTSLAYLYLGATSGLAATPTSLSGYAAPLYPSAVASAGDLNGDGFGDVVVGASLGNTVTVHLGNASGVSLSSTVVTGPAGSSIFGGAAAGVGDVDGDGLDDLAVGASGSNTVHIYRGGAAAPAPTPSSTVTAPSGASSFGAAVAQARERSRPSNVGRAPITS